MTKQGRSSKWWGLPAAFALAFPVIFRDGLGLPWYWALAAAPLGFLVLLKAADAFYEPR